MLYSQAWLRRARKGVSKEVRLRPEWIRESRRRMWKRHRNLPSWGLRGLLSIGFAIFAIWTGDPRTALGAFALWALLLILMRSYELQNRLLKHEDAEAFLCLPVGDDWLFRYQSFRVWLASLWLGADALALYAALAWRASASLPLIGGYLCAAVAQWLAALGAAALLFRLWPRAPFGTAVAIWAFSIGSTLFYGSAPRFFQNLFDAAVAVVNPVTPAGWIHTALGAFASGGKEIVFALPALALIAALPWNWRALRARYRFREEAPDWARPETPEEESREMVNALETAHPQSAAAGMEAAESGEWLHTPTACTAGVLERAVLCWLSERQRRVFDFLAAGPTNWSAAWRRAWIAAAICAAALTTTRQIWPDAKLGFFFGLSAWVVATMAAPMWGGMWAGVSLIVWIGQRGCAICSLLPLGYAELARVILKTSAVRLAAALPIYMAFGAFGGWFFSATPAAGALIGLKTLLLVMALQPLTTIASFSQGTNDTSCGFRGALVWFAGLALFLPLIGSAIVFTVASAFYGFLGIPATAVVAWIGGRIYRAAYERGWFDLLTSIRS